MRWAASYEAHNAWKTIGSLIDALYIVLCIFYSNPTYNPA